MDWVDWLLSWEVRQFIFDHHLIYPLVFVLRLFGMTALELLRPARTVPYPEAHRTGYAPDLHLLVRHGSDRRVYRSAYRHPSALATGYSRDAAAASPVLLLSRSRTSGITGFIG